MDTKLKIDITLNSDAIFSSGFSVAGGDDITVYKDELGLPYFKATSFKGLLRESMENIAFCIGENKYSSLIDNLLGVESLDFKGEQIKFTDFTLVNEVSDERIFSKRVFTSIEDGRAKDGSLRSAEVINRGLIFTGYIYCNEKDTDFIIQGLKGIKIIGFNKNRGFGVVSLEASKQSFNNENEQAKNIKNSNILRYKLKTLSPVIITDLVSSNSNNLRTKNYITGASIRGMVLNHISKNNLEFFNENKKDLLESKFLNTNLSIENKSSIPTIKGFYEDKQEQGLENIVINGEFEAGKKRASVGDFCAFNESDILYSKTNIDTVTRIKSEYNEDNLIFSTDYIEKNQEFEGYIILENEKLAPEIAKAFEKEVWIGADKYEGFGRCEVVDIKSTANIDYLEEYGYKNQSDIGKELYFIAISPFTMVDEFINPCGIHLNDLAKQLGVTSVSIKYCSTSTSEYVGFNSKWKAYSPNITMYDEGCIFKLQCTEVPEFENILNIQNNGLGVRQEDGFGRVLFIKNSIIDSIQSKKAIEINNEMKSIIKDKAELRQAKIKWIMKNKENIVKMTLSKSQIGEVQSVCETGDIKKVNEFLEKQVDPDSPIRNFRYKPIKIFIDNFIKSDYEDTVGYDLNENKLYVLCELFNYTRKRGR